MATVGEMVNAPIEITLGGKVYKARRLSLDDVFATAESEVISEKLKQIQTIASGLAGQEKIEYLSKATAEAIPSGEVLIKLTQGRLNSMSGLKILLSKALAKDQPDLQLVDISRLILDNADEIRPLVELLTGVGKKSDVPLTEAPRQ